jgi:hypothetical protein
VDNQLSSKPKVNSNLTLRSIKRFPFENLKSLGGKFYLATRCIEELRGQCSSNSKNFKCIKFKFQVNLTLKCSLNFNSDSTPNLVAIKKTISYFKSYNPIFYFNILELEKSLFWIESSLNRFEKNLKNI